eukprot:s11750_g1.t1
MCTCFESYLSEKDVAVPTSAHCSIHIKLDTAATRCCRLRLTLPSEQCVKSILAATAARSGGTCTEAELFLPVAEFKRVLRLKAKKVPKEGIHIECCPAGGPRELLDVLFKAAYDSDDGPVSTLLPAGQVALKAMDISLRPTNKKVRGIFATPKLTTAMVAANSMPGMGMGMGGMNMMANPHMGMMAMHGMPAASSTQGLMQRMKQQQDLASQHGGLNNLQTFSPGAGGSTGTAAMTDPKPGHGAAAMQSGEKRNRDEGRSLHLQARLDTNQALEEATKVSDALDNRKNGGQGKRTAEEFEEVAKPKGKAKAKAKSESKPKAKAQPKSILKKPAAHAAGREYWASLPLVQALRLQQVQVQTGLLPQLFLKPFCHEGQENVPSVPPFAHTREATSSMHADGSA